MPQTFMSFVGEEERRYDFLHPAWLVSSGISVRRGVVRRRKQGSETVVVLTGGKRGTEIRMPLEYHHDRLEDPPGTAYAVVMVDLAAWEEGSFTLRLGEDDFGAGWTVDYEWEVPEGAAAYPVDLSRPVALGGLIPTMLRVDLTLFNPSAEYIGRLPHGRVGGFVEPG